MHVIGMRLMWAFALAAAFSFLLLMLALAAGTNRRWARVSLAVLGILPGAAIGVAAVVVSAILQFNRWYWGSIILIGSSLWLALFAVGSGLAIWKRDWIIGRLDRPAATSAHWLLKATLAVIVTAFALQVYSDIRIESIRQGSVTAHTWPQAAPKWHFYNRADYLMRSDPRWLESMMAFEEDWFRRRVVFGDASLDADDRAMLRSSAAIIELLHKAADPAEHVGVPSEHPSAAIHFRLIRILLDLDARVRARDAMPGVSRSHMAIWQVAMDLAEVASHGRDLLVMHYASSIERIAASNLEAILADLPSGSAEVDLIEVPDARVRSHIPRAMHNARASAYHAFVTGAWPDGMAPSLQKMGGGLRWTGYCLFLRGSDRWTFEMAASYWERWILHRPLRIKLDMDFHGQHKELMDLWRAGPITRDVALPMHFTAQGIAMSETKALIAKVGLACRRFHDAEGRYPEALDELVPEYLFAVPPLNVWYRAEGDGCVVYGPPIEGAPTIEVQDSLMFRLGRGIGPYTPTASPRP